jgi:hypothetical protein
MMEGYNVNSKWARQIGNSFAIGLPTIEHVGIKQKAEDGGELEVNLLADNIN